MINYLSEKYKLLKHNPTTLIWI